MPDIALILLVCLFRAIRFPLLMTQVEEFPAFVVVDDKGNDFFHKWSQ